MWKFSSFSLLVDGTSNNYLIHNSFMGAVIAVSSSEIFDDVTVSKLRKKFRKEDVIISDDFATPEVIDTLSKNGIIIRSEVQEREKVEKTLQREEDAAYHLIILPHEDCNFRCTYCYETFERGKMPPHIVEGTKLGISRAFEATEGLVQFNLSWFGGEPCLALDVVDDISTHAQELCSVHGTRFVASMTTNGYFLKPGTIERLVENGVSHFQVTLDGSKETHNQTRMLRGKQGTFDVIYQNLLQAQNSSLEASYTIRVNVSQENYDGVVQLIAMLAPDFATDPRFSLDFHAVGQWGGPNDSDLPVFSEDQGHLALNRLLKVAHSFGFNSLPTKRSLCSHGSVCYAGKRNSLVVGSDGTLYKCTVAFSDSRNKVGWVDPDKGFITVSEKIVPWIRGARESEKCKSCSFMAACRGKSCPLESLPSVEPHCPKTEEQLINSIRASAGVGFVQV